MYYTSVCLLFVMFYGSNCFVYGLFKGCATFQDIFSSDHESIGSYRCERNCMPFTKGEKIYGTRHYSSDSLICRAALHAGVLEPEGGNVDIILKNANEDFEFVGTVRHRVVSYSRNQSYGLYYSFSNNQWIPSGFSANTWMTDTIMVHNSYNTNSSANGVILWATCLYEGIKNITKFYSWKYEDVGNAYMYKDQRIEYIWNYDYNSRIIRCLGKKSFMDVEAVLTKPNDIIMTSNITYRGLRGGSLQINFERFKEKVATERLPDSTATSPKFSNPTLLTNLNDGQSGYFIVREDRTYYIYSKNDEAAHFQLYIQDCRDDSYGINCENKCHCVNGGVCHPSIGACICIPGFHGKKCRERCAIGTFGSTCQFKCDSSFLGTGINERQPPSCVGLIFCLPEPFGCSCAFGYEGRFCEKYENLPFLKKEIDLSFNDGVVTVTFEEWDFSRDGGLDYGLKITGYDVEMRSSPTNSVRTHVATTKFEQKFVAIFENVKDNEFYDVRIIIKIEDPIRHHRQSRLLDAYNSNDIAPIQFSSPCLAHYVPSINQTKTWIEISFPVPSVRTGILTCHINGSTSSFVMDKEVAIGQTFVHFKVEDLEPGQPYMFETWCEIKFGRCERKSFPAETLIDVQKVTSFQNCTMTVMRNKYLNETEFTLTIVKILNKENWNSFVLSINEFGTSKISVKSLIEQSAVKLLEDWPPDRDILDIEGCVTSEPFLLGLILNYKLRGLDIVSVTSFPTQVGPGNTAIAVYVIATLVILILLFAVIFILKRKRTGQPITPSFGAFRKRVGRRFSKSSNELVKEPPMNRLSQNNHSLRLSQKRNSHVVLKVLLYKSESIKNHQSPVYLNMGSKEFNYPEYNDEECYINVDESNTPHFEASPEIEKLLNGVIYSSKAVQQFQSVPLDCGKPMQIGKLPPNILKNRFKNNLPYDENRVVLSTLEIDPHSDYINASFVKGLHSNKWYIACQGPKDKNKPTMGDFWRMVIELDVDIIVMIADFIEDDKVKVGRYFSKDEPLQINDFIVTVIESTELSHFLRTEIQILTSSGTKCVVHYQFIKWPDHGTPAQVYPICSMLKSVLEEFLNGTMVVHCSAGIGRTGAVLFVILLKEFLEQSSQIDPIFVLKHMRECRARLVENMQQYNFSLEALHYLLFSEKGLIDATKFEDNFKQLRDEGCYLYDELAVQPINLAFDIGQTSSTITLNRNRTVLPADLHVVSGTSVMDYINAIYVDLEDVKKALIVTEHPLTSTIYRFWQMVVKRRCSSLIIINENKPSEQFPSFYSVEEYVTVREDFSIDNQQTDDEIYGNISCYGVTISIDGTTHFLEVYQVHNWPRNEDIPPDISVLESISNIVLRTAQAKTPAVLCCSNGVTGCGLVASALNVISHLQLYQEINIYYVALKMRRYRPQFITSQRQFLALYEAAFSFLQNNSHYQNFQ